LETAIRIKPQARRSLKAYSRCICPIAAFIATSSSRFFGSPIAALLCPDSDRPPVSAASCSHRAAVSLPAPGSHPSHRTSPSRRRSCASTPPPRAPHPPPSFPPPAALAPRSSALPCACSETCVLPFLSQQSYSALCGIRGHVDSSSGTAATLSAATLAR